MRDWDDCSGIVRHITDMRMGVFMIEFARVVDAVVGLGCSVSAFEEVPKVSVDLMEAWDQDRGIGGGSAGVGDDIADGSKSENTSETDVQGEDGVAQFLAEIGKRAAPAVGPVTRVGPTPAICSYTTVPNDFVHCMTLAIGRRTPQHSRESPGPFKS